MVSVECIDEYMRLLLEEEIGAMAAYGVVEESSSEWFS